MSQIINYIKNILKQKNTWYLNLIIYIIAHTIFLFYEFSYIIVKINELPNSRLKYGNYIIYESDIWWFYIILLILSIIFLIFIILRDENPSKNN